MIGHRGAPATGLVENSLPGLAAALAAGADGVECDVRLSADGVCVLSHDRTLLRVAGLDVPVAYAPYDRLRQATVGGVCAVPRVEEVLDLVPSDRLLVLEVKRSEDGRGATGAALGRLLVRCGRARSAVVSSFHARSLRAVAGSAPGVRTALLTTRAVAAEHAVHRAARSGCAQAHPHVDSLLESPAAVAVARTRGMDVMAWTCDDPVAQHRLREAGVHGVICDDPAAAVRSARAGALSLPASSA